MVQQRSPVRRGEDAEMVASLKRILVALRNEHCLIMEALDHAIRTIDSSVPASGGGGAGHLTSLVNKVQFAVGSEYSDPVLDGVLTVIGTVNG